MSLRKEYGRAIILLVDPEAVVLDAVKAMLACGGYGVAAVGKGYDALELCKRREGPVDLLVVDVGVPGRTTLVKLLTGLNPMMHILYISGYDHGEVLRRGVDLNAAFIQKPFTHAVLLRKVRWLLSPEPLAAEVRERDAVPLRLRDGLIAGRQTNSLAALRRHHNRLRAEQEIIFAELNYNYSRFLMIRDWIESCQRGQMQHPAVA